MNEKEMNYVVVWLDGYMKGVTVTIIGLKDAMATTAITKKVKKNANDK